MLNRFFRTTDACNNRCIFELDTNFFWSRLYEYPFALQFITKDSVVLDACCGSYHPLKFEMAKLAKEAYAFDLADLSKPNILSSISEMFGNQEFDSSVIGKVKLSSENITNLPYADNMFDYIFCISALEHMDINTVEVGLLELMRIMKSEGKLILTIDYPTLSTEALLSIVSKIGLKICGEYDYSIPDDAIQSDYFGSNLYCYSMVLTK